MILLKPLTPNRLEELRIAALTGADPPDDWHEIVTDLVDKVCVLTGRNADLHHEIEALRWKNKDANHEIRELEGKLLELKRVKP